MELILQKVCGRPAQLPIRLRRCSPADAAAFFEENLGAKKPVIKTGAEIPFTRYFYKYQPSTPSEELETRFKELELSVTERVAKLFE